MAQAGVLAGADAVLDSGVGSVACFEELSGLAGGIGSEEWAKTVWQRIHDALRDLVRVRAGRQPLPTAAVIDSQTVRGADTVPTTATAGYDAGKKTKGRKRHIATDTLGLLLAVVVTSAGIQDRDGRIGSWSPSAPTFPPSPASGPTAATPGAW